MQDASGMFRCACAVFNGAGGQHRRTAFLAYDPIGVLIGGMGSPIVSLRYFYFPCRCCSSW